LRRRLEPFRHWYQDLCSCLQCDLAAVLAHRGHDALLVLGAGWRFHHRPGDCEPVEFYYPAPSGDVAASLAPHHPLISTWHHPADAEAGEAEVLEAIARGQPAIVAVDNYHLRFRPAYRDVHAGHLVVVHGFDTELETFDVLDPMPPAFQGPLPLAELRASRSSGNPDDGSDPFFAGGGMANRWLEIRESGPFPALTLGWVAEVLAANRDAFLDPPQLAGWRSGLPGLRSYVEELPSLAAGSDGERVLREVYVVGWGAQASASLHGDFLAHAARRLDMPGLAEAGRWVDLVAHAWTPLRMAAAHGLAAPAAAAPGLERHGRALVTWHERALDRLDAELGRLQAG
jgi:hypothetical protein